jgi:hypothetical protein
MLSMSIHPHKEPARGATSLTLPYAAHSAYERIRKLWEFSSENAALSLRDLVASRDPKVPVEYDHLVELLGDAQFDSSPFGTWVFAEAARILAAIGPDDSAGHNNEYSHAVKYLFHGACVDPSPHRSILDDPQSHAAATTLVDISVRFCECSHSLGTIPVLLRGIVASNLRAWGASNCIDAFLFHPESLRSPRFLDMLEHARAHHAQNRPPPSSRGFVNDPFAVCHHFCAAQSPWEFLQWAFTHHIRLPLSRVSTTLHRAFSPSKEPEQPGDPKAAIETDSSGSITLEPRQGIFVDIFGTLINHDGSPNMRLLHLLRQVMHEVPSRPVFLVSDSQDEEIERALAPLGIPLPPLIHKDTLKDSLVACLIDNCDPEPQGLHAQEHLKPSEAIQSADRLLSPDVRVQRHS